MNGLSGTRVLLLDDESDEALPVIKAFSKIGVPIAYFDGKNSELPTIKKRLRGVRLAILDMNLGITGSNETIASTLVQTFSRIIDDDNGPYGILIWTNHPNLKETVARGPRSQPHRKWCRSLRPWSESSAKASPIGASRSSNRASPIRSRFCFFAVFEVIAVRIVYGACY